MSESKHSTVGFETKGVTGRDGYIIAEALVLALKAMENMSGELRPQVDQRDILTILNTCFPTWEDVFGPA